MLHILNGDASARVFARSNVRGEQLVWRDMLVEGPVCRDVGSGDALDARADFLAARLRIDRDAYVRGAREQADALAAAPRHDEVVLWFEQDLFCAVNLWCLLDWLGDHAPGARLSLVYPSTDEQRGLGALEPDGLATLFERRVAVTDAMLQSGRRAWATYVAADPTDALPLVNGEDTALPFVREAFRCHLGRFPSLANGLNEVETAALAALRRGPRAFAAVFGEVARQSRVRRHGMGDVQFAACLRGLVPLVRLDGEDSMRADVEMTERGRDVVAGDVDWLGVRPIDTWLGGVHLAPGARLWRWDGARGRLVESGRV